jgi:Zn-dependent protease with chaperone function
MFCTNCGTSLQETSRFCHQCGQQVRPAASLQNCLRCSAVLSSKNLICPSCSAIHYTCRKCSHLIFESTNACPKCKAVFILAPGFRVAPADFEHPSMQQMNRMLRSSMSFNTLATTISNKVGKPWYESTFNSVITSEKQYPRVYETAALAARRLGLEKIPSVYIEADHGYLSATYGSRDDAFVNVGTFIPKLLNDQELLFVLGHELGHLVSNHALWMTVSMFLVGQQRSSIMSEGILSYFSNPLKLIEQGVESLITNWMRVAELTADRAALLVVGDIDVAKRALFLLHFKSRRELDEVDIDEWVKEQEKQDATMSKISQIAISATPYLNLRLKELLEFHRSHQCQALMSKMATGYGYTFTDLFDEKGFLKKLKSKKPTESGKKLETSKALRGACPKCKKELSLTLNNQQKPSIIEVNCLHCNHKFSLDLSKILQKNLAASQTRSITTSMTDKTAKPVMHSPVDPSKNPIHRSPSTAKAVNGQCTKCKAPFSIPFEKLPKQPSVTLQCNTCKEKFRIILTKVKR